MTDRIFCTIKTNSFNAGQTNACTQKPGIESPMRSQLDFVVNFLCTTWMANGTPSWKRLLILHSVSRNVWTAQHRFVVYCSVGIVEANEENCMSYRENNVSLSVLFNYARFRYLVYAPFRMWKIVGLLWTHEMSSFRAKQPFGFHFSFFASILLKFVSNIKLVVLMPAILRSTVEQFIFTHS